MNPNLEITAVIMAGGKGERFWPKSRTDYPKQFLSLTGDGETMIQKTFRRLRGLTAADHVFVVTNEKYLQLVQAQLPEIPRENLLTEPAPRNTAPCIALAAAVIRKRFGGSAVMLVLPSDHLIRHEELCADVLRNAAQTAAAGENLVTIGITPSYPETGYGYIEFSRRAEGLGNAYAVDCFKEKPDIETARKYVDSGRFLWNSGMFAWTADTFLNAVRTYLSQVSECTEKLEAAADTDAFPNVLKEVFPQMTSISVDFGILEHAERIFTIPGSFGWDDVGSWPALSRVAPTDSNGNYREGDIVTIGTKNCIFSGGKKLIAAVGLENIIIVDTKDALLVCDISAAQDVKQVTELLRQQGRGELL